LFFIVPGTTLHYIKVFLEWLKYKTAKTLRGVQTYKPKKQLDIYLGIYAPFHFFCLKIGRLMILMKSDILLA